MASAAVLIGCGPSKEARIQADNCQEEVRTAEAASKAFRLEQGEAPDTADDLVAKGYLVNTSPWWRVGSDGRIVPQAPCT